MAEYIKPVIDAVLAALEARMPAALPVDREPIREYGRQFSGVAMNPPAVYVMPGRTRFDPDAQGITNQQHEISIVIAITGSEPDDVTNAAMAYVRAVDLAIKAADAAREIAVEGGQVNRVFVSDHDYGPLRVRDGLLMRFPEIVLTVEVAEP